MARRRKGSILLLLLAAILPSSSAIPHGPDRADDMAPACRPLVFEGSRFTVCTAKPGLHLLKLVDIGPDGRPIRHFRRLPARLGPDMARLAFATNAGMYDLLGYPIGLHVEDGGEQMPLNLRDGRGNFHFKPNGVFYGDGKGWHVAAAEAFAAARPADLRFASQSGPMLVIDGRLHPGFAADGASVHIRNGVGVDAAGNALFAISDEKVSFGRFARLFRDGLGCRNALYFDGFVSQLWDPATGRRDGGIPLGPMVVALQPA